MPDLSDSVNWSEVDADNNNAAPNGWPEGMMPSGVNDAARADRGALKRFWNKINPVQTITPTGGLYTFTTDNPAYPTGYVDGELYCFRAFGETVGGDRFRVNGLPARPIWKRVGLGAAGYVPVGANDFRGDSVQLVYGSGLNSGIGAFVLENPFVPISGDGTGTGVGIPGSLTVAGSLAVNGGPIAVNGDILIEVPGHLDKTIGYLTRHNQAAGSRRLGVTASAPGGVYFPLEEFHVDATATTLSGPLSATGYKSRSGVAGPYQADVFNLQWTGTAVHLWIDSTDAGPIVIAPPGADLTTPANLIVTGGIQANGTGATSGGVSIYAAAGAIRSDAAGTALYLPNGNVVAGGADISGGATIGTGLVVGGTGLTVNGPTAFHGGADITGGLTIGTGLVVGGSGLTVNGVTNLHGDTAIIGNLTVSGTLNGHPAMALFDELDALTARVVALEAALTAARTE